MTYKTLIVHVDNSKHCDKRLDVAIRLSRKFDAHLTGVYALPDPYVGPYMTDGYVPLPIMEQQVERGLELADQAETMFNTVVQKAGINAQWESTHGHPGDVISQHSLCADLAILGQPDPDDSVGYLNPDLPAEVTLASGRPVLIVPYIGIRQSLGKNIMVAWNTTRESTRAVNDALPILRLADKVSVMAVDPAREDPEHNDIPGADIALHLARHGVNAEAMRAFSKELEVAHVILSRIADIGADMLVMGAYGHSRMRELIMGGATREILRHMTVPVLMSH